MKFDLSAKIDYDEVVRKMDDEYLGVYCSNIEEAKILLKSLIESGFSWDFQDADGNHSNDWNYTNYGYCNTVYSICCGHISCTTLSPYEKSIYYPNPCPIIHFRNIVW